MGCEYCVRMKGTPRSDELKRRVTRRVNRAIGQLNGIKQMVEENRYCGDVLTQLAAVESAVRAISREVMADHMETCVIEQVQSGNTEVVSELMQLLRKFL
ncbi:MAG: metal-sensing transcriptional repressor [Atopobiaceae bacterium]|nr:metal-sensing transcriptional repressor [Atopobiaceae bacterium]